MDIVNVVGIAHKGQGDEVGADLNGPTQILTVLLAQGGHGDRHAGQVEPLVVGHVTGHFNLGDHVGVSDGHHAHGDIAVVNEKAITGAAVPGQALERS